MNYFEVNSNANIKDFNSNTSVRVNKRNYYGAIMDALMNDRAMTGIEEMVQAVAAGKMTVTMARGGRYTLTIAPDVPEQTVLAVLQRAVDIAREKGQHLDGQVALPRGTIILSRNTKTVQFPIVKKQIKK